MEGKLATSGRYDDISEDLIPPTHESRGESHIGPVYTSRTASSSSTGSTNGSRPVMRGGSGNRPGKLTYTLYFLSHDIVY